ncbi:MAG TPA: AMP-binding protein [Planctomycetota bacterium]|nr:AMP-binding protein [Planctomycetota bacterium]
MTKTGSISIRECFAGKGILLTGSTGFLAKAVVEKLLRDLPEIGQIYLLIRARVKPDGSRIDARERLRDEILRNSAFGRLREQLGENFESFCESKITCVAGNLTAPRLGLDDEMFNELSKKVHIVMNSAATVVFDERLDLALDLNTMGPQRMLEFAKAAGAAYVHISTAYVSGKRTGFVPEKLLDPMEAIDAQLPAGVPRPEHFDVREEVARLGELAETVKADCRKILKEKGIAPDSEEATTQLRVALVAAGMRRAQSLGWNDTYTYTKFLGEQLIKLNHGDVPAVVVRPSIIESSYSEPEPGWLDGLRMADPIIIGFGKGRLADFPADQNVILDIIPADMVVNAILASAAYIANKPGGFDLFTIASSAENPLVFRNLYDYVRDYFQKHPMTDRAGKPVPVPTWRFPTVEQYRRRVHNRYLRPIRAANVILNSSLPVPGARKMRARLRNLNTTLEQLLYYVDIYGPYVNLHCRFEISRMRSLLGMLSPEERERFDFDPQRIRWKHYLQDVHIPGLKRNILRMDAVPRAGAGEGHLLDEESEAVKKRGGTGTVRGVPQTVVDLCARGKERFGGKSLVEIRRITGEGESLRITYNEMFDKSAALARTLIARLGLHPGDRIAILGDNGPEWPLAYMAISRACCTAVPIDRQLPPREAARLIKLVDARAIILSPALYKSCAEVWGSGSGLPPCLNMMDQLNPFPGEQWPYPEASIGDRVLKDPAPESLASILFTSGTTVDPKGVMLSHSNVVADALSVAEVLEPMESDRFLSVLPLHHAFEFTCGFLIPMYGGSTIHHIEVLRAKEVLDTMKLAEITVTLGVPRLFKLFMDGIKAKVDARGTTGRFTVSMGKTAAAALEMAGSTNSRRRIFKEVHEAFGGKLRLFVSGGAPLAPEIYKFFKDFGITIAEGYGLTETSPVLTVNPLTAPKAGSVGPPVPGVEIKISNPDHTGIGEVLARGPTIMHGYWQNPAATEKAFENGWFRTGDLGHIDRDGYLHITGRLKDVIVTAAGKNVYPDEVEAVLRDIAGVKDLCVLGIPARSGMGEEVMAVVVPQPDANRKAIQASVERLCQALPSHQRVSRIEFQDDDLPKTSTLKVQRGKVRARYTGEKPAAAPVPAVAAQTKMEHVERAGSDVFVEVARAVADSSDGRIKASDVTPDIKLEIDLGIDSIGRMEVLNKLEMQLEISIPPGTEGKLFTVRDVMHVVEAARKAGEKSKAREVRMWQRAKVSQDAVQAGMQQTFSKSLLQGVFSTSASVFMNTFLSVDCKGLENVPVSGPYILAANHCSHLDSVAIREVLGKRASALHVMGAKDYFFDTRVKSWFFTTFLNALPFDREENAAESLATCKTVLDSGRAILLFPEGTRSISGELQAFKPGIGVLGVELDVPVIPVYLRGTYDALPKGRSLPRAAKIRVTIGQPVTFEALKKERGTTPPTELYRRAASELRTRIEGLANLPESGT